MDKCFFFGQQQHILLTYFKIVLIFVVTAELKMDVLREREVKDNLERQLVDEQKMRGQFRK